jgi:DNA-binding transcriptional LysR family regulator
MHSRCFQHARYVLYALAVATHRSYRRAAIALRVRRSTLARHIRDVESEIGFRLFEHHSQGARLTKAGKVFVNQARRGAFTYGKVLRVGSTRGLEARLRRDSRLDDEPVASTR